MRRFFFIVLPLLFLTLLASAFQDQLHLLGGRIGSYFSILKPTKMSSYEIEMSNLKTENALLKEIIHQLREEANYPKKEGALWVGARVIFREPAAWGCYIWIDKGYQNGEGIVALFSPVVLGENLLGMIDFISDTVSRVCLITHSKLSIAVEIEGRLSQPVLGEICGGGYPLWRKELTLLQGLIFNYPYLVYHRKNRDLLITSGQDGVFPRGLKVGVITDIEEVKEGAISTPLKAKSLALEEGSLAYVQVLSAIKQSSGTSPAASALKAY